MDKIREIIEFFLNNKDVVLNNKDVVLNKTCLTFFVFLKYLLKRILRKRYNIKFKISSVFDSNKEKKIGEILKRFKKYRVFEKTIENYNAYETYNNELDVKNLFYNVIIDNPSDKGARERIEYKIIAKRGNSKKFLKFINFAKYSWDDLECCYEDKNGKVETAVITCGDLLNKDKLITVENLFEDDEYKTLTISMSQKDGFAYDKINSYVLSPHRICDNNGFDIQINFKINRTIKAMNNIHLFVFSHKNEKCVTVENFYEDKCIKNSIQFATVDKNNYYGIVINKKKSMKNIKCEQLKESHATKVLDMQKENINNGDLLIPTDMQSLLKKFNNNNFTLGLFDDEKLVGFCCCSIKKPKFLIEKYNIELNGENEVGIINTILIEPPYRKFGLGNLLLNSSIDKFREKNIESIYCTIDTKNRYSIKLFNEIGFVNIEKNFIIEVDGVEFRRDLLNYKIN